MQRCSSQLTTQKIKLMQYRWETNQSTSPRLSELAHQEHVKA
jgi:hypothetical protein